MAVGSEGGGGALPFPRFLAVNSILTRPELMPATLLRAPPDFQTFLWPCDMVHVCSAYAVRFRNHNLLSKRKDCQDFKINPYFRKQNVQLAVLGSL